ncbi:MAG: hypothetical protein AAF555_10015 [Verrucomicrobiota bacterium]
MDRPTRHASDAPAPLEEDRVWDLLEKAPPRRASPAFSQKVLRAVRQQEAAPSRWVELGKFFLRPAALVGAAAVLLGMFFLSQTVPSSQETPPLAKETSPGDSPTPVLLPPNPEEPAADSLPEEFQQLALVDQITTSSDFSDLDEGILVALLF